MDIVKPIPANKPAPNTNFQFISGGRLQMPDFTAIKLMMIIPIGLPIINPVKIPIPNGSDKVCCHPGLISTAVLANANKGRIINATGLCNQCCNI